MPAYIKYMATILNPFCFDIVSTVIYVRITISGWIQSLLRYHTAWITNTCGVVWKLSRQGSTWKYMEGRSIILYLSFSICSGRQTFVQTSFTEGIIWVPHCVSNMNTHGSLKWLCCASFLNAQDSSDAMLTHANGLGVPLPGHTYMKEG